MALSVGSVTTPTLTTDGGGAIPLSQYNTNTAGNTQQLTNATLASTSPYIVDPSQVPKNILGSGAYSAPDPQAAANEATRQSNIAGYTDQLSGLNRLLGRQDYNQQQGTNNINQSFDRSNAQLTDQNAGQNQAYDRQQKDTTTGFQDNLNTINSQARNGYQGLQALLGGSGSAGEVLAPLAVSDVAGSQTNKANMGFGKNLENLQVARTDAATKYKSAQDDLLGQKNTKLQSLINSIDQQKQAYQEQIGQTQNQLNIANGGSYQTPTVQNDAIAQLQAQQDGLAAQYAQPAFTPQHANYQAPNMQGYTAQAAQIGSQSNTPINSGDPAAAMQLMLQQQAKKTNNNNL